MTPSSSDDDHEVDRHEQPHLTAAVLRCHTLQAEISQDAETSSCHTQITELTELPEVPPKRRRVETPWQDKFVALKFPDPELEKADIMTSKRKLPIGRLTTRQQVADAINAWLGESCSPN